MIQKIDHKQKAKALRGDAKTLTAVGAGSGIGWLLLETGALETSLAVSDAVIEKSPVKTTKGKLAIAAGVVALGALGYAAYKHMHANKIEAEQAGWESRVAKENASLQVER